MRVYVVTTGLAALLLAAAARGDDCKVAADRSSSAPIAGIERVEIEAEAGNLHVVGAAGATSVEAHGKACASSDDRMKDIRLEIERKGGVLQVSAKTPGGSIFHIGRAQYATLDLTVTVPADLPVKVTDTSGDLEIAGVLSLDLTDESGDILVHDIAADVAIDDSSGDLTVTDVKGSVTLKDGSGDIKVARVAGKVTVTSDGSGDIDVDEVGHGLAVLSDGSGEINFSRVRGTIEIPARTH